MHIKNDFLIRLHMAKTHLRLFDGDQKKSTKLLCLFKHKRTYSGTKQKIGHRELFFRIMNKRSAKNHKQI